MAFKILPIFCLLIATSQAVFWGIPYKPARTLGISNLANVPGNEVGIDGAVGFGEKRIGAHSDVLGQKSKVHADILDQVEQHKHGVFNRQYVLQRQCVLVRKYLDNGQNYDVKANEDDVLQHKQVDESRMYDSEGNPRLLTKDVKIIYDNDGGWWDRDTGEFYHRIYNN